MPPARRTDGGGGGPRSARSQRATPKVRRWTDLVAALLRHHYPVSFDELAREVPDYGESAKSLETRKRMFERDKKELLRFGVPIETRPDEDGEPTLYTIRHGAFYLPYLALLEPAGRLSAPRHGRVDRFGYKALQRLAFEPDELAAVADAAARVVSLGDPLLADEAESAMRKLAFDLPLGATAPTDAPHVVPPRARAEPGLFETLSDALRDCKVVTFAYHAMGQDGSATRVVEPWGLFYLGGHWYLAGRDRDRGALRNFRLSRMRDVARNTTRESTPDFEIPTAFRLREHARSRQAWELGDGDAEAVEVEFVRQTGAVLAASRLGAPVDGLPSRRRFTVRRRDAFVRWLLALAGDARPVSPAGVVEAFDEQVRRTMELYSAIGSRPSATAGAPAESREPRAESRELTADD